MSQITNNKIQIFSKVDLNNGYWQTQLDEASSLLTTFQANKQYTAGQCYHGGLITFSVIFQRKINDNLQNLKEICYIADDITR